MDAKNTQETIEETPVCQRDYRTDGCKTRAKRDYRRDVGLAKRYRKYEGIRHCQETIGNTQVVQRDYRTRESQVITIS